MLLLFVFFFLAAIVLAQPSLPAHRIQIGWLEEGIDLRFPLTVTQCEPLFIYYESESRFSDAAVHLVPPVPNIEHFCSILALSPVAPATWSGSATSLQAMAFGRSTTWSTMSSFNPDHHRPACTTSPQHISMPRSTPQTSSPTLPARSPLRPLFRLFFSRRTLGSHSWLSS